MRERTAPSDDDSDPLPVPIVPLPRRLPSDAIGRLIADTLSLLQVSAGPPGAGVCPAIVAYRAQGEEGVIECWTSCRPDSGDAARRVVARLDEGVRLALPVHGGPRAGALSLIDGRAIEPEVLGIGPGGSVADAPPGRADTSSGISCGFFALGLGREAGHVSVEPMFVEACRGGVRVRRTVWPEGLRRCIAAYLARLD